MQRTENEIFLYIQYATEDGEHEKFKIFNPIYNTTQPTARIVFLWYAVTSDMCYIL